MTRFRRLNVNRLPRVMVRILALDLDVQQVLREDIDRMVRSARPRPTWAGNVCDALDAADSEPNQLAIVLAEVLELTKAERADFADRLDRLLDAQGDLFGTEGQNDPRGDRRELG